ncbi:MULTISPECIES: TRC40/GET3/ArsA family transport-energizing ATPase [unclassified Hydrogenobaculum]|uniref:TRC40/GET3/ArsA family transport-energizing ATPase n=1 Tax=unclassified Hydrogenobaculum TaxID=2622382 RepID=UPI0001C51EC5|nr:MULTISPECIES: TRC40/GET3/ArsA family transport-energizing ATPase [unclassified Hydrogenobaculum]AEF19854.1 arsenite-activated ATPase ArsA [Hydrogenobaculum sp. 3684]AEG47140.1 arsenite-activated ATPase ArsA [Hydrogenobaculum sp. SHO]AGG15788.1 arsenite efflux ATP-binding protein ArsA [Hydrogenobaculum sp. HO]AGH94088.1 arsenite-activated ATPase ArsA [Hydrogenobaculum sp. SN]
MRIILFSGKGGVGKTTVSAATGYKLSKMGYKTIVVSLDPAHSLGDSFDIPDEQKYAVKGLPIQINENLYIQEIDIQEEIDRYWGDVYRFLELLFNTTGLDGVLSEELAILPGMEEVTSLLYVNKYYKDKEFDVLILDLPPTGESLRFVSMPTVLKWYMKRVFKTERMIFKVARPVAKRLTDVPLPDDDYFQALENFYEKLKGVDEILIDPDTTSVRIVANPEKMVVKESQRAYMYFNLFGVNVDAVVVNKVLPKDKVADCEFFKEWVKSQQSYLEEIKSLFNPTPIFDVPTMQEEVCGLQKLEMLSDLIYKDKNPADILFKDKPFEFLQSNGNYMLKLRAPYIRKDAISVIKGEDEIIVRAGNFKSHVMLPRKLRDYEPIKAKYDAPYLYIDLAKNN